MFWRNCIRKIYLFFCFSVQLLNTFFNICWRKSTAQKTSWCLEGVILRFNLRSTAQRSTSWICCQDLVKVSKMKSKILSRYPIWNPRSYQEIQYRFQKYIFRTYTSSGSDASRIWTMSLLWGGGSLLMWIYITHVTGLRYSRCQDKIQDL